MADLSTLRDKLVDKAEILLDKLEDTPNLAHEVKDLTEAAVMVDNHLEHMAQQAYWRSQEAKGIDSPPEEPVVAKIKKKGKRK